MPQDIVPIVGRELPKVLQPVPRVKTPDSIPIQPDSEIRKELAVKEDQKGQAVESNISSTQQIQTLKGTNIDAIA